jgi:ABC-type thiamin/hydroxymethylpyrimidine transport system permease subunit
MERSNRLQGIALILVLSSLGAAASVFVGYGGTLLSAFSAFPPVASQLLAGLHVFWLTLTGLLVSKKGSATMAGAVKGLIEASFFSHLGVVSFAVSLLEGAVVDVALAVFKKKHKAAIYLAGGLSSASNLIIVQFFFLPSLPLAVYAMAYSAAFLSGLLFGGYLTRQVLKIIPADLQMAVNPQR